MSSSSPNPADAASVPDDWGRVNSIVISAATLTFASVVTVALRFYVRAKLLRSIKIEDWCMLVSMLFGILYGVFIILESQSGLGRPRENVSDEEYMNYRKWSYIGTLGYNMSLCFTKIAILMLYLRVLTHDYIRKVTWVAIAIVSIYNTWGLGMYFTFCIPLERMWNKKVEGYCHPTEVWWALTYLHIITDFMIFIIPIPVVVNMTIPGRQKAGLLVVFTLGLFLCIISIVRTVALSQLLYLTDTTWHLVTIANWSTAEVNVGIICGCMPTLKPLLSKIFRPLMDHILPYHHQSLEDPNSTRPRTIGSMPLNAFRFGGQSKRQGTTVIGRSSRRTWTEGTTLARSDAESTQHKLRNMDSQAELNPTGGNDDDDRVVGPDERPRAPPTAHARD